MEYDAALAVTGSIKGISHRKLYKEMGLVSLRFRRWVTRVCTFFNIKTNGKSEHLLNLIPTDKHSQVTYCVSSLDQVKKYLRKIRYFKKFVFFIHNSRTNMIEMFQNLNPEAVIQRCSIKQVLLKISQNSHDNTCARFSFLKSCRHQPATL